VASKQVRWCSELDDQRRRDRGQVRNASETAVGREREEPALAVEPDGGPAVRARDKVDAFHTVGLDRLVGIAYAKPRDGSPAPARRRLFDAAQAPGGAVAWTSNRRDRTRTVCSCPGGASVSGSPNSASVVAAPFFHRHWNLSRPMLSSSRMAILDLPDTTGWRQPARGTKGQPRPGSAGMPKSNRRRRQRCRSHTPRCS